MTRRSPHLLALVTSTETGDRDPSRGSILDGALAMFLDVGIRRTTLSDIAKRSGISPATLYRRFDNKSTLVQAVAMREVRRFLADADDVLAELADSDAETQVVELGLAVLDGTRRNRLLTRLLETEPELILPLLTTNAGPVVGMGREYLANFFRRLQVEGKIPELDPEPISEVLARLALSISLTPESALPLDDEKATRAILRSLILPVIGLGRD
jgi:AcrR family transcriptional regulator